MLEKKLTAYEKHVIRKREYLFSTDTPCASPFGCAITNDPIYSEKISQARINGLKNIMIPTKDAEKLEQRALKIYKRWNAIGPIYSWLYPIVMYINNKRRIQTSPTK